MADDPDPKTMRADTQSMLSYIQGARIVSMARETAISRLQGWLIYRFWAGVLAAALAIVAVNLWDWLGWWGKGHASLLSGFIMLMLASRVGAIVSIGRRMNADALGAGPSGDSIFTLAILGSGRNGLALALLSSNAFGLVMFALFASGLPAILGLSGGIVPSFIAVEQNSLVEKAKDDALAAADLNARAAQCSDAAEEAGPPPPASANDPGAATDTGEAQGQRASAPAPSASPQAVAGPSISCETLRTAAREAEATASRSREVVRTLNSPGAPVGNGADTWFDELRAALGLTNIPSLFKLLLWAFIAGFFEKMVPDMLDSLAARSRETKKRDEASTN